MAGTSVSRTVNVGLENGLVNLINRAPPQACRHVVLALTEISRRLQDRVSAR